MFSYIRSLGWEDPPEKKKATHSSILAWRIPWSGIPYFYIVHGITKSWTQLSAFHSIFEIAGFLLQLDYDLVNEQYLEIIVIFLQRVYAPF